jgi:C2H2-type zinc finger
MLTCQICNKTFSSSRALAGHNRMHSQSNGAIYKPMCCCVITRREIEAKSLERFQARIRCCQQCNKPLNSYRKFCNHSCAAKFTNTNRTEESYEQQKITLRKTLDSKSPTRHEPKPKVEYSKVFLNTCAHCQTKFTSRLKRKYCDLHKQLYCESAKEGYKFTFNVYCYPELFDLDLLTQLGWYAPGGKSGNWNLCGLSRDHKVSVNESIKNNYDPYYITHPLNCELMPHSENNVKKTKSSITYEQLKELIDAYDKILALAGGVEPPYRSRRTTLD